MTQTEFAKVIGKKQNYISRYERAACRTRCCPHRRFRKVGVDWLLTGKVEQSNLFCYVADRGRDGTLDAATARAMFPVYEA
jgi:hypothetical protein